MTKAHLHLMGAALSASLFVVEIADKAASQVACYRRIKVHTLDRLFGPEEHFEFAGYTSPPIT